MSVLEVKNLQVCFHTRKGIIRAVEGATFSLDAGKTLALVGESGSGKSVSAMSILRLLDSNGFIDEGEILFSHEGKTIDLVQVPMEQMYSIRGDRISVIFQEPMTALNPVFTIGRQLREPFLIHRNMSKEESQSAAIEMLKAVKIPNPEGIMREYAHRLSGGMRQRVMIAMALACQPNILIADEPTTALDVTIQAQILRLMRDLQAEKGTAILFITHDLGVVREMADTVAVMYCGQVVELVPAHSVFDFCAYSHPYTEGLLLSAPSAKNTGERLQSIKGNVPSPHEMPKGCRFSPRCPYATQKCVEQAPNLTEVEPGHCVRCFYAEKEVRRGAEHKNLVINR